MTKTDIFSLVFKIVGLYFFVLMVTSTIQFITMLINYYDSEGFLVIEVYSWMFFWDTGLSMFWVLFYFPNRNNSKIDKGPS